MIMTCIVTTHATKNTLTHGNRAMRVISPGSDRIKLPPFLPQDHCGLLFLRRTLRKTNQALWDKGGVTVWNVTQLFFFPARQYSNDFFGCQHSSYWRLTYSPYWWSLLLCRFNCARVRVLRQGIFIKPMWKDNFTVKLTSTSAQHLNQATLNTFMQVVSNFLIFIEI